MTTVHWSNNLKQFRFYLKLQKMTGEVLQDLAVQSMQDWMSAAETFGHPCMKSKYFYAQSLTHAI